MATELPSMTMKAIGIVRNGIRQAPVPGWRGIVSEVVIDSHLAEALDIKPYIPGYGSVTDAKAPIWITVQ